MAMCEAKPLLVPRRRRRRTLDALARLAARFGGAMLVAVAALDPGNLEIDIQAGSLAGYHLMWAVVYASAAGWALQNASAQLALATRRHLSELCALEYADAPLVRAALGVLAALSVLAFDVAQVLGIAVGLQLLLRWPLWLGCLASAADTVAILALQARGGLAGVERAVSALLIVLAGALCYELALCQPDLRAIADGALVPRVQSRSAALLAVGFLGSLVQSPNLFLHSWLVANRDDDDEEDVCALRTETAVETAAVFLAAVLVNGALLAVAASSFYPALKPMGLRDASALLNSSLGSRFAATAWAVALLCSGHAATVTAAISAQTVLSGFLRRNDVDAVAALGVRALAICGALFVCVRSGVRGADSLVVGSQVVLAFALPFASVPMIRFLDTALQAQNKGGRWHVVAARAAFLLAVVANIALTFADGVSGNHNWAVYALIIALGALYCYVLTVVVWRPLRICALLGFNLRALP